MLSSPSPCFSVPLSQLSTSGRYQVLPRFPRRGGRRRNSLSVALNAIEFGSRESYAPEDGFLAVPTFKKSAGVEIAVPGEESATPFPSQFSAAEFILVGLVLLLAFWVSNFVAPEFMFGRTAPANGEEDQETMEMDEEGIISDGDGNLSGRGFQNKGRRTRKSRRKSSTKA